MQASCMHFLTKTPFLYIAIMQNIKAQHPAEGKIGVFACGPAAMKDQLAWLSQKHSTFSQTMIYHEETYEF